jgi:hypothetical protein
VRITRVTLRDVRTHRGTRELELARGLTVIRGPNEAGKSTFLRAVELALTRRVTSTAADLEAMRTWDAPNDRRPEVVLERAPVAEPGQRVRARLRSQLVDAALMRPLDAATMPAHHPEKEQGALDRGERGGCDLDVDEDPGTRPVGEGRDAFDVERVGGGRHDGRERRARRARMRRRIGEQDVGAVPAAQPLHRSALRPRVVGRAQDLHQPAALEVDLQRARRRGALPVGCDELLLVPRDVDRRLQQVGAREP